MIEIKNYEVIPHLKELSVVGKITIGNIVLYIYIVKRVIKFTNGL